MEEVLSRNGTVIVTKTEINSSKTMEGSLIHIEDAAPINVEECITTLEPIQDLHGYSKPWVGGSGKNLLYLDVSTIKSRNTAGTWNGNTFTSNYGPTFTILTDNDDNVIGIKVNGTANADFAFNIVQVNDIKSKMSTLIGKTILGNGCPDGGATTKYGINFQGFVTDGIGITDYGSGTSTIEVSNFTNFNTVQVYIRIINGTTLSNLVFYPMLRLATVTDATFEPYSNICPIDGHTGVDLTRTGKNLLNTSTVTTSNITFAQDSNGYITANPTTADPRIWSYSLSQYKATLPAGSYKLVAEVQTPTTAPAQGIAIFDSLSHYIVQDIQEQSLFSTEGIKTINFELSENSDIGVMAKIYEGIVRFIICKQTDTTSYEPYTPETHSITFPQAQSPVYGCDVDWINGVLRVTKVSEMYDGSDDENWVIYTSDASAKIFRNVQNAPMATKACLSNYFVSRNAAPWNLVDSIWTRYSQLHVNPNTNIVPSGITAEGVGEWKTWLQSHPLQACYELDEPLEIPLTPKVITLLKGENNIYTDAGTSTLTYQPDNIVGELKGEIQLLQSQINTLINQLNNLS